MVLLAEESHQRGQGDNGLGMRKHETCLLHRLMLPCCFLDKGSVVVSANCLVTVLTQPPFNPLTSNH